MRIALFLKQKKQEEIEKHISQAVVFDMEEDKVIGVENETLETRDAGQLSLWAYTNKVEEIYLPYVDEKLKSFFEALGIRMKGYDELGNDKLFQTFIL